MKTAPPALKIQYPFPVGVLEIETSSLSTSKAAGSPRYTASPRAVTDPSESRIRYPAPDGVGVKATALTPAGSVAPVG